MLFNIVDVKHINPRTTACGFAAKRQAGILHPVVTRFPTHIIIDSWRQTFKPGQGFTKPVKWCNISSHERRSILEKCISFYPYADRAGLPMYMLSVFLKYQADILSGKMEITLCLPNGEVICLIKIAGSDKRGE
jgi:hypothetical protein